MFAGSHELPDDDDDDEEQQQSEQKQSPPGVYWLSAVPVTTMMGARRAAQAAAGGHANRREFAISPVAVLEPQFRELSAQREPSLEFRGSRTSPRVPDATSRADRASRSSALDAGYASGH
jgi:hypothetical protein